MNHPHSKQGAFAASHRGLVEELIGAGLSAANPAHAVERALWLEHERLVVSGKSYDLSQVRRLVVVGAGKAGAAMAQAAERILGDRINAGLVIVPHGAEEQPSTERIKLWDAAHPVPDLASVEGAARLVALLEPLGEDDLVICLLSGGASALLALPAAPLTLRDTQRVTATLLRAGPPIDELNAVRKHLSRVKGGQLVAYASPAPLLALILSDVVGDHLPSIASGPTVPDPSTFEDAMQVLREHRLLGAVPSAVAQRLSDGVAGLLPETPKPDDRRFDRVQNVVVGSNALAAEAVLERARERGLHAQLLTTYMVGAARHVGSMLGAVLREMAQRENPLPRPSCLVVGGETTVEVRGTGRGGRNQELALAAALEIQGLERVLLVTLATDGVDGPTDAAGAMVDGSTIARARERGLKAPDYLLRNDAYAFFDALGDLVRIGPTGTNVNDIVILIAL